jgi:tetratricopeptide (TPR) repeat protein
MRGYTGKMAEAGGDGQTVTSLLEHAEAKRRAGLLLEARAGYMEAAKTAEAGRNPSSFVRAALGVGGIWVHEHRDVVAQAAVDSVWQRARALAQPGSVEEARLAVRQAAEAVYQGAPVEAVMAGVEAVRAFGDEAATAEALSLLHHVLLSPRYAEVRLGLAEEVVRLGARGGDQLLTLMGLCWRTVDLFLLGDVRAGQSLEELRERSAAEGCEALCFVSDVLGAMVSARAGRFEKAEAAATKALDRGTAAGDPDAPAYYGAMLAVLRWWQGREKEVIDLVRTISMSPRLGFNDHVYVSADAALSAAVGDFDSSEEALARLSGIGLERLPPSSSWLTTEFLVAETAYLLGDAEVAASAGELLAPYAHLPVMPSLAVVCLGSAERALGLCAATTGRMDAAVHHLDAAIRADRRLGNRPMAVLTEHTLAGVLRAGGGQIEKTRAEQLAQRAEERARRIGMVLPDPPAWLVAGKLVSRITGRSREASLRSCPAGFRITVDGRATVLPDRVGFSYLVELIVRPGRDVDVLSLASSGPLPAFRSDALTDERALSSYRRRVRELNTLLCRDDLEVSVANRYRRELASLTTALRSSVGLGGRARAFPDNNERARTAVRKALVRAVSAIEAVEPDLGLHLQTSLVTGVTCRYSPAPGWNVTADARGSDRSDP